MKRLLAVIVVSVFTISFLNLLKIFSQGSWGDYSVYYHGALAASQHNNPYLLKGDFVGGYIYPPISLIFFYPLTLMSLTLAGKIWATFSILCLLIGLWVFIKQYKESTNYILLCILGILVFNYFPVKFTLGMGQINNVIFLLMVIAIHFLNNNHPKKAGILLGITLTLKYTPLFILPYLFIRKRWQTLLTLILTVIVSFIVGFIIYPDISYYFIDHVLFHVGLSSTWTAYYNQALSGFLIRDFSFLTNVQLTIIRYVISLVILLISLYIVWKSKQTKKLLLLEVSIFITVNLLLNTFSEQHHFVFLLIPLIVTYFTIKENKLRWHYYSILGVSYLLTAMNLKNPSTLPVLLQSHVFYGTVILWILELHLLQKISKTCHTKKNN